MTDKEQLDKIAEGIRHLQAVVGTNYSRTIAEDTARLFDHLRPRLARALRLLEIKETMNALDDGDEGQTVVR